MSKAHNFLSALVGSFSKPAAENPTVAMIEAAFRHHGLDARYINCEVEPASLGAAARGARAMGWRGFNCSIPHKVAIIDHLDGLGESAATIGAVNCAVRRGDRLIGENTDGVGFMESLRTLVDPMGKSVVVFGAGGAARAIAVEAALAGAAKLTIVNRGKTRGRELTALINDKTKAAADFVLWDRTYAIDPGADIIVNATSIGLFPDVDGRLDIDLATAGPETIVADVIPNPPRTLLVRDAEARGLRTLDGLGMLVNQGVVSIRHWFGIDVDGSVMRRKVEELFRA
jgi:shikimate dehydrogenase